VGKFVVPSGDLIFAQRAAAIGLTFEAIAGDASAHRGAGLARRVATVPAPATPHNKPLVNPALEGQGRSRQTQVARPERRHDAAEAPESDGRSSNRSCDDGMSGFKDAPDAAFESDWLGNR
jgi:hypothetical protein